MSHILIKTIKIALWTVIPIVLTSHISTGDLSTEAYVEAGTYDLMASGDQQLALNGNITYESALEKTVSGNQFNTLRLQLENATMEAAHMLEFLISVPATSRPLAAGTYKIASEIDGFLNNFDGAFGFAQSEVLGEKPYFTEKGSITLASLGENELRGTLKISMVNTIGKKVDIKGNFIALRKKN